MQDGRGLGHSSGSGTFGGHSSAENGTHGAFRGQLAYWRAPLTWLLVHTTEQLNAALAGRYVVARRIGSGGMATVYLARDLRHDRPVALKVLNPELGAVLGVERFLSEIHVTANLQHPNLLPLFDSGESEGLLFYVMPYVEGESLRARLDREKQLPIDDAVRIAASVGGALDYAHRHGVIHRDLKPENILLPDGQPLVADFGIALAVSNAGGQRITQTGLSLGTPQYMSPEQATGDRTLDARSDIYSLGAVLYEMLTGEPPHQGNTAQAIIAKVLTDKPRPVRLTRDTVPPGVAAAVERALAKLPADRFPSVQAFIAALTSDAPASATTPALRPPRWVRRTAYGIGVIGVLAAVGWSLESRLPHAIPDTPAVRFALPEVYGNVTMEVGGRARFAVSPDGRTIAFIGHQTGTAADSMAGVYVRAIDQLEPRLLSAAPRARSIAFSPNGRWVAWATTENTVIKARVDGGPSIILGNTPVSALGLTWLGDSDVVIGTYGPLYVVPASGGPIRTLTHPDSATWDTWPLATADAKHVLFARRHLGAQMYSLDVATGRLDSLGPGTSPLAVINGSLAYAGDGVVRVAQMRPGGQPLGTSIDAVQNIMMGQDGEAKAAAAPGGTLVYVSGKQDGRLALVNDRGVVTLTPDARTYLSPRFSPDGKRIAVAIEPDVWILDRAASTLTRMTSEGANDSPEWTPDGKRIVFVRSTVGTTQAAPGTLLGIWWRAADGSDQISALFEPPDVAVEATLSPDARWLLYRTAAIQPHFRDILAVPLEGDRKPIPVVITPKFNEYDPRVSPDGHWVAYQSSESGRPEVYVQRFPEGGSRTQVSADGGNMPLWPRRADALFYTHGNTIVRVAVKTSPMFTLGERRVVATGDWLVGFGSHPNYDVSADGSEILVVRPAPEAVRTVVVYGWAHEISRASTGR
jgi:serine/threonine-protein kinase